MNERTVENIFTTISNNYYRLTASEKKVADYVFAHKNETQYMSISELAEESGVAEATISRFCRCLKMKGYHDFKLSIAKAMATGTSHNAPIVDKVEEDEILREDDLTQISSKLYHTHVSALAQTMKVLNLDNVKQAADMMCAADHVYCMGQGASMILAQEAEQMFSSISPNFRAVADSHRQATYAALMTERDVVLFFSYSGSTKEIVDTIHLVHEQGGKVILITRFVKSPGGKIADVVLQCGSNEGPLQLGSASAKMVQLYILDILYNEIYRRNEEEIADKQEKIAKALAVKHI